MREAGILSWTQSIGFTIILVGTNFLALYISLSKFLIPKIKDNLDDREKIKENLDSAKEFSELAEMKNMNTWITCKAKKEVIKILTDSKKQLDKNIGQKKQAFEKELEKELLNVEKDILSFKNKSGESINKIAEEITAKVIENLTGDKLNNSSIRATVLEISKKKIDKYLWL